MGSRWRLNYTLAQLLLVVVMVANVCGVIVAVRAKWRQPGGGIDRVRFSVERTKPRRRSRRPGRYVRLRHGQDQRLSAIELAAHLSAAAPRGRWQHLGHRVRRPDRVRSVRARQATHAEVSLALQAALARMNAEWGPWRALSDNGAVFAAAYANAPRTGQFRVFLWDVASGKILHTLDTQGDVVGISLAPDGKTLAVNRRPRSPRGDFMGQIELWDVASGLRRGPTLPVDPDPIEDMIWADGGDTLVWRHSWVETPASLVRSLRLSDGRQRGFEVEPEVWSGPIADAMVSTWDRLLVSADGRTIVVSNSGRNCRFLDAATLKPLGKPFPIRHDRIRLLGLSADGKELATTNVNDQTLRLRMLDQEGNFRRDLVLFENQGQGVMTTLAANAVVFVVCLSLLVAISRSSRRRAKQYSDAELRRLQRPESQPP